MQVKLGERQNKALEVGCPFCGQQKGKKCKSPKTERLQPAPHKQRVDQARDVAERKAAKFKRPRQRNGNVTDEGLALAP
jgi:predicted  nucleic acid-binding Zn-ribbon protein